DPPAPESRRSAAPGSAAPRAPSPRPAVARPAAAPRRSRSRPCGGSFTRFSETTFRRHGLAPRFFTLAPLLREADQITLQPYRHRLGARGRAELGVDIRQMVLDGAVADLERGP